MDRRTAAKLIALAPLAPALNWTRIEAEDAARLARSARASAVAGGTAYDPQFFTAHEYATVRELADMILPRDERSGSATDAGVPEFMDFIMIDSPGRQTAMRGGLAWLDDLCQERHGSRFIDCTLEQRGALLDQLAWPARAPAELSHGVAFFNSFRDLTATGFWSSKVGVEDLQYMGNRAVRSWDGCPPAALEKLGVSYDAP
ncbi:MAG: gluconate 2-dehydrogenase subunit 3 family protein [Longimicrobiales bacterium]